MASKNVIHSIFDECKSYTTDPYWKEQFEAFAANRFPVGVKYDSVHKNLMIKGEGRKSDVIAIQEDTPTIAFQTMMKVLKERLGLRSNKDLKFEKQEMEDALRTRTSELETEWKKIKPRNLRDQLIMDFITKLKTKYSLTLLEHRRLVSTIQLGFQFKALSPDDVVYEDGKVTGVNGLTFNKKTREFETPATAPTSAKSEKPVVSNKFYSVLDRYYKENAQRANRLLA